MANSKDTKARTRTRRPAKPRTDDAVKLAALRWLAMKIEQLSIEAYVTSRDTFDELENSLRAEVRTLQRIGRPKRAFFGEDNCPDGYIMCKDGMCAPMCDDEAPPPAMMSRSRARRS